MLLGLGGKRRLDLREEFAWQVLLGCRGRAPPSSRQVQAASNPDHAAQSLFVWRADRLKIHPLILIHRQSLVHRSRQQRGPSQDITSLATHRRWPLSISQPAVFDARRSPRLLFGHSAPTPLSGHPLLSNAIIQSSAALLHVKQK